MRRWLISTFGPGALGYSEWRCFFFLHREVFRRYENATSACGMRSASARAQLHRQRLGIEFHMWSEARFWRELMEHADELRARYARAGGRFIATTLLRDPRDLALSAYAYSAPIAARDGLRSLLPLPQWLSSTAAENAAAGVDVRKKGFPQASGIQTRALTCYYPAALGCSAFIPANRSAMQLCNTSHALAQLRRLDLVCMLPNISSLVSASHPGCILVPQPPLCSRATSTPFARSASAARRVLARARGNASRAAGASSRTRLLRSSLVHRSRRRAPMPSTCHSRVAVHLDREDGLRAVPAPSARALIPAEVAARRFTDWCRGSASLGQERIVSPRASVWRLGGAPNGGRSRAH